MIQGRKKYWGCLLLAAMMALTGAVLFREQSPAVLWESLKRARLPFLLGGLCLMLGYVGCEALCTRQILRYLGHRVSYRRCLGYSFVGFYVSSITPSATGGQPAQIYCMSQDGIPAAHGALNMLLIAACYQTAALIWGGAVWLLCPRDRGLVGSMGVLLCYGAGMMLLLTVGMGVVMFLPGLARRVCGRIWKALESLHLLRDPAAARGRLERQLAEYAEGAACVRANPGLALRVLLLCLIQLGMLFSVPWMVYLALGLTGWGWLQIAGLQALLTLAVCNLPLPGAVGPAEGGFVAVFTAVFGAGTVAPAMLMSRGISFYAFLVISFVISLLVQLRIQRQAGERALRELAASHKGERVRAVRSCLHAISREPV